MLDKILSFINSLLDKKEAKKNFNIDTLISKDMIDAIRLWKNIYEQKAPWADEKTKASSIGAQVASEFARLTTLEMESEIIGSKRAEYLNAIYDEFKLKLNEKLEIGNALGGIYFKPYVADNKIFVNSIAQGDFAPVAFDGDGNLISVIFSDEFVEGKNIYTRIEWHILEGTTLLIINKAFKSSDTNALGNEVPLNSIKKWANLSETAKIINVKKLLGGFYKVPKANHINSKSPLGVSIYSRAIDALKKLDEQASRLDWEYESGERRVYVDVQALTPRPKIEDGKTVIKKPKVNKRLFESLDVGDEDFFKDYSPEMRDEAYLRGLNKYKQDVEFKTDLAYGTISDPAYVEKTAEEIRSSKHKSYDVVTHMQRAAERAINDLIYSIDVLVTLYKLAPPGAYEVSYKWDDSLIVDAEKERTQDLTDMRAGIMGKVEYRMKWYGETEEEAKKKIPEEADVIE